MKQRLGKSATHMKQEEESVSLDEMLPGARVAVQQCLAIRATDRVFVVSDEATAVIGQALVVAAQEKGAETSIVWLEQLGQRPITAPSERLFAQTREFRPTVTFYAARALPGEFRFRVPFVRMATEEFHARHGHMIGITPILMRTGMMADYEQVAARTLQICEMMQDVREIRITNKLGTDLVASLDPPRLHWHPWTGLYHQPGQWGNLPEGETFTCPAHLEGVLAANVLGDYFSEKYGLLDSSVIFHLKGEVSKVEHRDSALAQEVWDYLNNAENGRRPAELAFGTNEAITQLTGNLLQDEKYPGIHVAFGNPYTNLTGGDWTSEVHVDVIPVQVDVWADGKQIMSKGRFVV